MTGRILFGIMLAGYLALVVPFSSSLVNRPVLVKLGTLPEPEALRIISGDQRFLVAQSAVVKVLFYYGTLVEKFQRKVRITPEYYNMYRTLVTASKLDPWNADVYYFTQAAFTWELNKINEVNGLLDYGMRYRTWDYQLPFFAGFNSAYFLKDYKKAASYFEKAAQLRGDPLLANLSSRYFYESGQNRLALSFIDYMAKHTTDSKVVAVYEVRKKALLGVMTLEEAALGYQRRFGKKPERISDLVSSGVISSIPVDPYGGQFYLDGTGKVRSTSKFSFPVPETQRKKQ
jgi:hypothetical protein